MKTLNLRSTATLTKYVNITDKLATLARQMKELETAEKLLRPNVLAEIGERKEIAVRGQVRVLVPTIKETIRQADTSVTAEEFKKIGLPVNVRTAEYVAPAAFTSLVKKGVVPESLIEREWEKTIVVT